MYPCICVHVHMSVYVYVQVTIFTHECRCLQKPEASNSPGTELTSSCEPPNMGAENRTLSSGNAEWALNHETSRWPCSKTILTYEETLFLWLQAFFQFNLFEPPSLTSTISMLFSAAESVAIFLSIAARDRDGSVSSAYAGPRLLLGEREPSLIAKYIRGSTKNKCVA